MKVLFLLIFALVGNCFAQGWTQLTNTALQTVCPPNNFPLSSGVNYGFNGLCFGKVTDYGGGAVDTKRNRFVIWGGGHAGYRGNEVYALDLQTVSATSATVGTCAGLTPCNIHSNVSVPTMTRLNDPTAWAVSPDDCRDEPDGGLQAVHSLNGFVYLPKHDVFFQWLGDNWCGSGNNYPDSRAWWMDPVTGRFTAHREANTDLFPSTTCTPGICWWSSTNVPACVLDPTTVDETVLCMGNQHQLVRYNADTDRFSSVIAYNGGGLGSVVTNAFTATFDPDRKVFYFIGGNVSSPTGSSSGFWGIDIGAGNISGTYTAVDYTSQLTGCGDVMDYAWPGITWDSALHRIAVYVPRTAASNAANNQIFLLDPATMTCVKQPLLPDNGPAAHTAIRGVTSAEQGMWGRFAYIPGLNEYVLINDPLNDAYTFKLNANATNGIGSTTLTCVDRDGDGYGTGPGCTGPDADDQDSAVHTGAQLVAKWGTLKLGLAHLGYAPDKFWYLSTTGSDSATCNDTDGTTNITTPCATWAHIRASVTTGDMIIWRGGVYTEYNTGVVNGATGVPVIYMSYPGELAQFNSNPSGFDLLSSIWVVLDGFHFANNGSLAGVAAGANTNIVFRHIDSSGNQWGLDAGGDSAPYIALNEFTIEDSVFHGNALPNGGGSGQHGIYLTSHGGTTATNIFVRRNLLYNNDYTGMQFNGKARNLVQEQNITYNNWLAGFSWENGVSYSRHTSNLSMNDGQGGLVISNYDGNEGFSQCGASGTDACNCTTPNKASICADDQINNVVEHYSVYLTGTRYPDGLGSCSGGTEATCNPAIQVARQGGCTTSKCLNSNMGSNTFRNLAIYANGVNNNYPPIQFPDNTGVTFLGTSTFQNIVVYKAGLTGVIRYGPPDGSHNYTCGTWPTGTLSNCLNANPLFVAASATYWNTPTSFNLRLTGSSPAKATGTTVLNYQLYDILGTPFSVTTPNIGAYEGSVAASGGSSFGGKVAFGGKATLQ